MIHVSVNICFATTSMKTILIGVNEQGRHTGATLTDS